MTKEELMAMGLTEEQAKSVLAKQTDEMKNFVPRTRLDEVTIEKEGLKTQLADRDKDIDDLKKNSGSAEDLQSKLTELESKYQNETTTLQAQLQQQKLESALDMALIGSKARNPKAVRGLLDMSKIKLKDDGTLEGLDIESLQKSDSYLFESADTKDATPKFSGVKLLEGSDTSSGAGQPPKTFGDALRANLEAQGFKGD